MPDYGQSKDALRAIVGLSGEFVGTTDAVTITNKTIVEADNVIKQTTPALGAILVDNGTKFVARARPAANLPLHGNSGGTDIEYSKLEVAGGGTGAVTLSAGVVIASGTSAFTTKSNPAGSFLGDSDVQNNTGLKTFFQTTLGLRNRANSATATLQNPVFTGAKDWMLEEDYDFVVFVDANDSNKVKAKAGGTQTIEFSHASDLGSVLGSIHGSLSSTSGGTIKIKSGSYAWATKLSVTKAHVGIHCDKGVIIAQTNAADTISVEKDNFQVQNGYWDLTSQGNGNGSWIVAGVTTNSDFMRVTNNYVKSPGTNGISLGANCGGSIIMGNQIQSFLAPTGDGIVASSCADHSIIDNGIGGFANATNGYGIRTSSCLNMVITDNRVFVNRINVRLYFPRGIVFANNLVQAATQHGIQVVNDTANDCGRCLIIGNRVHDNSTSSTGTYSGISISPTSTGVIDNMVVVGNMCSDQSVASKKQKYGIEVTNNANLLTNSTIAFNALAGNQTAALSRGTYSATTRFFGNSADTIPYSFEDFIEDRVVTIPSDPAAGFTRRYSKVIDSNNDGLFVKRKINGAVVEVML